MHCCVRIGFDKNTFVNTIFLSYYISFTLDKIDKQFPLLYD